MSMLDDLFAALSYAPALPGAACVGRSELFDSPVADQTAAAIAICATCPVLTKCRTWWDGLASADRPLGVVAGCISAPPGPAPRRKPRPDLHEAVAAALRAEPGVPNCEIADRVGCSIETVSVDRRALETAGQIPRTRRMGGRKPKSLQQKEINA